MIFNLHVPFIHQQFKIVSGSHIALAKRNDDPTNRFSNTHIPVFICNHLNGERRTEERPSPSR